MSGPDITILQHLPHEPAGVLGEVLAETDLAVRTVLLGAGEPCPSEPAGLGALVVLGGDMCTDDTDRYPFLTQEVALLERCIAAGAPVLGLCLGAQLLAEATRGSVAHETPETGYPPVTKTREGRSDPLLEALPDGAELFNAHRDQVTVGPGSVVLARSAATAVQAFRVGTAYGLQFHPEFDAALAEGYVEGPGVRAYLTGAGCDPENLVAEARRRDARHRALGSALFTRWLSYLSATRCPQASNSISAGCRRAGVASAGRIEGGLPLR